MYQLTYMEIDTNSPFLGLKTRLEAEDYNKKDDAISKVKVLMSKSSISNIFLYDTIEGEFIVMDSKEFK